jgi:hypothetical protein
MTWYPPIDRSLADRSLEELKEVLAARAAAIVELRSATPSKELAARLDAAIKSGESIRFALESFRQRILLETRRLERLKSAHLSYLS